MCSQNRMVSSKAAGGGGGGTFSCLLIQGICDMAALADVGVDFVQDFLPGRSKMVKERYPNARGFSVRSHRTFLCRKWHQKKGLCSGWNLG